MTTTTDPMTTAPGSDDLAQLQYIESAQLPDGSIAEAPGSGVVNTYLSGYAALGLAQAAARLQSPSAAAHAESWLNWYAANEGGSGVTTDAVVSGRRARMTGQLDAADATSGLFLEVAWATFQATGDTAELQRLAPAVTGAIDAIRSLQDADGLTWALDSYHVKYLMDEAEAYAGLTAGAHLESALGDSSAATAAADAAARLEAGVQSLWDPSTGGFDWAVHSDGAWIPTNWSIAYPDALENAWAVAYGLTTASETNSILTALSAHLPTWAQPGSDVPEQLNGVVAMQTLGFWPVVGWAYGRADPTSAQAGATAISGAAASSQRAWPYSVATAGQQLVLEAALATGAPLP